MPHRVVAHQRRQRSADRHQFAARRFASVYAPRQLQRKLGEVGEIFFKSVGGQGST
jgi:hypothetical protein